MADLEELRSRLRLDASGFTAPLEGAASTLSGFQSKVRDAGAGLRDFGADMRKVGKDMTTKVTLPVAAGFTLMVNSASDLNEAQSATKAVFGESADSILKWSKTTATGMGISEEAALTAAVQFASLGKTAGLTGQPLNDFSTDIVQAASDLGSFYNVDPGTVLEDLKSGLAGESEPLRKYGIFLNEASVAQKAMEMTGKDNAKQLTEGDKIAARSALIMENLGDAQGDFARTSKGLANQLRILRARFKDVSAHMGQVLLPYVLQLVDKLQGLLTWVEKLSPGMQKWALIIAGVAAAMGPVLIALGVMATALGVLLSPIGLVLAAVALLGVGFATNFLGMRDAIGAVAEALTPFYFAMRAAADSGIGIKNLVEFLPEPLQRLERGFLLIADAVGDLVAAFRSGGFSALLDALPSELNQVLQGLTSLAGGFAGILWDAFVSIPWSDIARAALDLGMAAFRAIPWGDIWNGITDLASGLASKFVGLPWVAIATGVLGLAKSAFIAVPWGDIWSGITTFATGLYEKFENFDYNNLGFIVGAGIRSAIDAVGPVVAEVGGRVIDAFLRGMQEHWKLVLAWMVLWPVLLPMAIGQVIEALAPKAREFMSGFMTGLGLDWDTVIVPWLQTLPGRAADAIGDLTATLLDKGTALIAGLRTGAEDTWDLFVNWLTNRGFRAYDAIGDLIETLLSRGTDLIQGLYDGATELWQTVNTWLGSRDTAAANAIGNLGSTLKSHGRALIDGLWQGAGDMWDSVWNWLSNRGSEAASAVGNLSGYLVQAGKDLVQGLINGIMSMLPGLQNAVNAVNRLVDLIDRGKSPWPMFIKSGKHLIGGLVIGMGRGMPDLIGAVANVNRSIDSIGGYGSFSAPSLGAVGTVGGSGGNTYTYGDINIRVDGAGDPDVVADRVFSKFSRELGLTMGGA